MLGPNEVPFIEYITNVVLLHSHAQASVSKSFAAQVRFAVVRLHW